MVVRELLTRLGLDVDAASFAEGNAAVEIAKAGLEKLAEVAKEMVSHFVETVQQVAETGDQVKELSQSTGVAADALQRLGNAAKNEGVGLEGVAHSLTILTRTMAAAKGGSEEVGAAFHKLKVKVTDARGHLRAADEVFLDLAEAMKNMPDGAEKTSLAFQVLGRSGPEMIKVLNMGREEIEELGRAGLVLTQEQVEAGDEMVKQQRRLARVTEGIWRSAIAPLLPMITDLIKRYTEWKKANAEIMKQRIRAVLEGVFWAVGKLGAAFAKLHKAVSETIGLFQRQWKVLAAAATLGIVLWTAANYRLIASWVVMQAKAIWAARAIAWEWALAAAPFVAIGGAIFALMVILDDLKGYHEGKDSLIGRFKAATDEWLADQGKDPWWLRAIKNLVIWMEKALGVAQDLGLVEKNTKPGGNAPAPGQAQGDVVVKRNKLAQLLGSAPTFTKDAAGNPQVQLGALDRLLGSKVVFGPSAAGGGGAGVGKVENNFHITQLPGEDSEAFAHRVANLVDQRMTDHTEAAAAALPAN